MKRRLGSFFYRSSRQQEVTRKRWDIPAIIGRAIRKTCTVIGGVILFFAVLSILGAIFMDGPSKPALPNDMILVLNVEDPIGETAHARSLADPLASAGITIGELITTLDRAKDDKRVRGLLVSLDNGGMELAHIQELRTAVKRFRESGKFATIYTSSFADLGSGIGAYYLASAFDEIWMQPVGFVSMTGLAMEMPFGKDALDKAGVQAQFLHREEYKSAMESFTNTQMSAPNREMMGSILDDLSAQIFEDIKTDRKLNASVLQAQLDKGLISGPDAVKAGLITRVDYADVLLDEVREKITKQKNSDDPPLVLVEDYNAATAKPMNQSKSASVGLVRIAGEIVPGTEDEPGYATGDYLANAIMDAADDPALKVIVVRIDSPGGSPTASETIRRALVRAKEKGKKVLVSMGPVAASGGYWVAVDADKIFAMPSTLTGSIGVIMGKFEISGLWKKIGVNWDGLSWGKNARMWSMNAPLTESEIETLNGAIDVTYQEFIDRVAEGRKMDAAKVRGMAKGRAWTGTQAKANGLVDEIGGLDAAMDHAATLVGAKDRTRLDIRMIPEPLSPWQELMRLSNQLVMGQGFFGNSSLGQAFAPYLRRVETIERSGPVQAYDPDLSGMRP